MPLFRKEADYAVFERIMIEAQERHPRRSLAWSLMKDLWHFVVWPRSDDELTTDQAALAALSLTVSGIHGTYHLTLSNAQFVDAAQMTFLATVDQPFVISVAGR